MIMLLQTTWPYGPNGPFVEQEVLIDPRAVEMLVPVAIHEAGHLEVADHFRADIIGMALAIEDQGLRPMARYTFPDGLAVHDMAVIHAAGSAAEKIMFGRWGATAARGDQQAIRSLSADLPPYESLIGEAEEILLRRNEEFRRVASALKRKLLESTDELRIGPLEPGLRGAYLMRKRDFLQARKAIA